MFSMPITEAVFMCKGLYWSVTLLLNWSALTVKERVTALSVSNRRRGSVSKWECMRVCDIIHIGRMVTISNISLAKGMQYGLRRHIFAINHYITESLIALSSINSPKILLHLHFARVCACTYLLAATDTFCLSIPSSLFIWSFIFLNRSTSGMMTDFFLFPRLSSYVRALNIYIYIYIGWIWKGKEERKDQGLIAGHIWGFIGCTYVHNWGLTPSCLTCNQGLMDDKWGLLAF